MKKIFSILIILVLIACLVSCANNENITQSNKDDSIQFWTDEETGVEYIIYNNVRGYAGQGGITPRLNADGSLFNNKNK
jgi:hypothetical protein